MVTPPTSNDIDFIRGQVGDKGETFIISQPELVRMWNKAEGDEDVTIVYALRRLKAHYAKAVTSEGQDQRVYNSQLFQHYSTMLADAERSAGMSGASLSTATLKLNLNLTEDALLNGREPDGDWYY
jgi:hypothetical protein